MAQSKLYHYAVNFEKFQHPEPYHLCWQHVVRNNSLWIIFDWLTGENCLNKNGLGHIVCHYSWHIRGTGSFSLDDKFWVQHQHKGCFPSSKGLKLHTWKLKTAKWLKTADEIAQCVTFVFLNLVHWQHLMLCSLPKQRTNPICNPNVVWAFKTVFKNISPNHSLNREKLLYSPEFIGNEILTVIEMDYSWRCCLGTLISYW